MRMKNSTWLCTHLSGSYTYSISVSNPTLNATYLRRGLEFVCSSALKWLTVSQLVSTN